MAALETRNIFGLNVLLHTRDKSARWKAVGMALLYVLVAGIMCFYMGGLAYGLIALGLGRAVPAYLMVISAMVVFFFGIFKAGGSIFSLRGLDTLCALPVQESAIVTGRFIRMYAEDLTLSLAVLLPGLGVYAWLVRPGVLFYPLALLAALFTPLIPLALATLVGAAITALTARMKHKSLVMAALSILATVALLAGTSSLAGMEGEVTVEMLRDLSQVVLGVLGRLYPPALWMGTALTQVNIFPALLWMGASLGCFALVAILVSARFQAICRRLAVNSARHDYRLTAQKGSTLSTALLQKELRRYFASPIYVTNTVMGPVMGLGLAVALFFVDLDTFLPPGLLSFDPRILAPFLLAWPFCLMPVTAASVSLEGKNLWIAQSLPLTTGDFLKGKLLFSLLLNLPFLVLAVILSALALHVTLTELLWLAILPALFTLFSCVLGLFVNLHLPLMNWENETRVVKQSASAMVACLAGMLLPLACAAGTALLSGAWVLPTLCAVLLLLTLLLWQSACSFDLKRL